MALYEQEITGSEPAGGDVTFEKRGPGSFVADTTLTNPGAGGAGTADYEWDTDSVVEKIDTTITFVAIDSYGAEDPQTVNIKSWFHPSLNLIYDISGDEGVPYSATVTAATHEIGLTLALTYDFSGVDEPAGFTWLDNGNGTADITWTPTGAVTQTNFDVTVTDNGPLTLTDTQNVLIEAAAAPATLTVTLPADRDITSHIAGQQLDHSSVMNGAPAYGNETPDTWLWEYVEWSSDGSNWNVPDGTHRFTLDDTALENPTVTAYDDTNNIRYKIKLIATVSSNGHFDSDEWIGTHLAG